ncbi:hypothetical protein [Enhydrobacter sp.]|jgi:hypothetical protein|uniref:hypothetical protein n=1 Tax=Enhydrobacter sp. TaxID=1894999 RepID=UPI002635E4D3|nr:hypothetical protein [Enhydrobacter sp.]WIM14475.1 MAG: hypothetical protein OJF58_005445 [Enhydrobacter sp.]
MDIASIMTLVAQVLQVLPGAIAAGIQVEGLITRTLQVVRSPTAATEADLDRAHAELLALKAQLDADPVSTGW